MNVALEKFKNIKSGLEVTIYVDENNGMCYAKSDDVSYFTRHYDKKDELYKTLANNDFQRWDEKEIARAIEKYNNPNKF